MIPNYFGQGILFQLTYIWQIFSTGINFVYDLVSIPVKELFDLAPGFSDIPILGDALDFILDTLGFGDWSLLSIMFGAGLFAYLIVALLKFVLGLFGAD